MILARVITPRIAPGPALRAGATFLATAAPAFAQPNITPQTVDRSWTHLGGGCNRLARVSLPVPSLTAPAWIRSTDQSGNPISFAGQAGIAVHAGATVTDGLIFAAGRISPQGGPADQPRLFAFSRSTGAVRWQSPIAPPQLDSFSSPTLDERNQIVVHASGAKLQAFHIADGSLAWERALDRPIVNASPLITDDLGAANRLFITDYDGYNGGAKLYCLNVDPFHPTLNPHQPGDLIWSIPIGSASGNSVSYLPIESGGTGVVFVATVGESPGFAPGIIMAFPVSDEPPSPMWTYQNEINEGYFGGVCIVPAGPDASPGQPPVLYAATYSFYGGSDTANLVKLNALTGESYWSVPSNRTQSIPVPLPSGGVALAAGIEGFGTNASLQKFEDQGLSARLEWDTSGFFIIGGWTHQPVATQFGGRDVLAVGAPPTGFFTVNPELFLIDLNKFPNDPGFVVARFEGAGGNPAIVGSNLYSIGTLGLVAFGPSPTRLDVNADTLFNIGDLYAWEKGEGARDVNADGLINAADRAAISSALRSSESARMGAGRQ